jgi:hypothetical protein
MSSLITIPVSGAVEHSLRSRAAAKGIPVESYVSALIDRDVNGRDFDDPIYEPIQKAFAESGMTEDELGDWITSVSKSRAT